MNTNYLDKLNPAQRQAATTIDGPLLIIAGAGSGKTTVLVNRLAYMIENGINPANILLLTFTNTAADNMKERAEKLGQKCDGVTACTYHSFCAQILRKYAKYIGLHSNFSIISPSEAADAIRMGKVELEYSKIKGIPNNATVVEILSKSINTGKSVDELVEDEYDKYWQYANEIKALGEWFQKYKSEKHMCDYDDLLVLMNQLLDNKQVQEKLSNIYRYVMVDEYQDTNNLQESIVMKLCSHHKNLCVVGDDYQCWHKDSKVVTPEGVKTVANLQIGDMVQTIRKGKITFEEVTNKSKHCAKTITITTESGKQIRVTRNHKMFASQPEFSEAYYLYIMYRTDKGFRIGLTTGGKTHNINARTQSERPEKLWYLGRYATKAEAHYYENMLSMKYQIPQLPFYINGRNVAVTQEQADSIFEQFGKNGFKLLKDYEMSFDYPNFIPNGITKGAECKKNVHLQMDAGHKYNHVSYEHNGIRIRKYFSNYKEAALFADELTKQCNATLVERLFVNDRHFLWVVPASQLTVTMKIPVVSNNEIKLERIVDINSDDEKAEEVYHIEVAQTGILIADEIASHNSIYKFRGSDINNILDFPNRMPGCKQVIIATNYRSTAEILAVANNVMENYADFGYKKSMLDCGKTGKKVKLQTPQNQDEEANYIVSQIKKAQKAGIPLHEMSVLFRSSMMSTKLELALNAEKIPYRKLGGLKFLDHVCIQDMLAFLRTVANPADELAWYRILCLLPGIGDINAHKIAKNCSSNLQFLTEGYEKRVFAPYLNRLRSIEAQASVIHDSDCIRLLVESYRAIRQEAIDIGKYSDEGKRTEAQEQLETDMTLIAQLVNLASEHATIPAFLDSITLESAVPAEEEELLTLSTIHSAKGMEWRDVYILDCADEVFPKYTEAMKGSDDYHEELRCFYVALTRAKENLCILCPQEIQINGAFIEGVPAHFLQPAMKEGLLACKQSCRYVKKEKCYLNIPYAEKDHAKSLGAKWDPEMKKWYYYSDGENDKDFARWIQRNNLYPEYDEHEEANYNYY